MAFSPKHDNSHAFIKNTMLILLYELLLFKSLEINILYINYMILNLGYEGIILMESQKIIK